MESINSTFGIGRLIAKHLTNALDADEQQQLDAWLKADEKHAAIFNRIVVHESLAAALIEMQQIDTELALANVKMRTGQQLEPKPRHKAAKLWKRYLGVAAAVAAVVFGIWFYNSRHSGTSSSRTEGRDLANDIAPGGNRATLTANGKTIALSDAKTGIDVNAEALTYNDGTTIDPSALGIHHPSSRANAKDLALEVSTPRGGTYSIILQDGTKVWLNADSKLEFFSNYRNKLQRIVKLIGEAYFEVARNRTKPFLVESNGQRVEVLGTHFNISAYKGEAIRTTLLEGSVSVRHLDDRRTEPFASSAQQNLLNSTNKRSLGALEMTGKGRDVVTLKPNQQSLITANQGITVTQVDANEAISWKEGKFSFNREEIGQIMKKIERWYNVETIYHQNADKVKFTGTISRYENISGVIKMLESTGELKFKLEGRKVYVER